MSDFITLSCPVCTGQLQITEDLERFACAYCGTEHIVRRTPGTVSLQPLVQGIQNVQKGVDRTASELAIARLEREIKGWSKRYDQVEEEWEDKAAELETADNFKLAGYGLGGLILVFAIASILGSFQETIYAYLCLGFLPAPVLHAIGQSKARATERSLDEITARLVQIDEERETRKKELARHREIASSFE